jgi:hypothetical protein
LSLRVRSRKILEWLAPEDSHSRGTPGFPKRVHGSWEAVMGTRLILLDDEGIIDELSVEEDAMWVV